MIPNITEKQKNHRTPSKIDDGSVTSHFCHHSVTTFVTNSVTHSVTNSVTHSVIISVTNLCVITMCCHIISWLRNKHIKMKYQCVCVCVSSQFDFGIILLLV